MDTDLSDMSLWTLVVPKKGIKCEVEQSADRLCYVHVTNVALPPNPPPGPHSLVIKRDGQEICIATLEKGAHPQHTLDFILDSTTEFVTLGPGPTHLIGYLTMSYADDSDDEDGDEDEDEDEDDAAPQAVPIANGNQGKAAQPKPAGTKPAVAPKGAAGLVDAEAVEGEEDEDEDDEDYPMGSDDLVGEMEEDEGEDDEGEDDDDDDEDEEDEDDEGEDDEGEEEELEPTPPAKPQGKKRAAEGPPSKSPYAPPAAATPAAAAAAGPASKKAKATPAPAVTPAAKPSAAKPGKPGKEAEAGKAGQAKAGKPAQPSTPMPPPADAECCAESPVAPKNEAEYEAALVSMLKSKPNGSAPLASIGNSVAKPPGVSKMAAFIKARPAMFKLDSTGANVSLVKP
ncbi:hypothetical protein QJQ45_029386 [Haematococcus lacustris]|nr:hypothetical protein QJQ45_029386 [Haematococcus lacustris]